MKSIAIFDLDGTIALIDHRRHLVEGETKDWSAFYRACVDDVPNEPVIYALEVLATSGMEIWILSGRSDEVRAETLAWLDKHEVSYHQILMRKDKDYTPDNVLKKKWLDTYIPKERVAMVFDDRDKVVRMWRDEGLTCFQVAPGDF